MNRRLTPGGRPRKLRFGARSLEEEYERDGAMRAHLKQVAWSESYWSNDAYPYARFVTRPGAIAAARAEVRAAWAAADAKDAEDIAAARCDRI